MTFNPVYKALATYDRPRSEGDDWAVAGVKTFDPVYDVLDGTSNAFAHMNAGCSAQLVAGDFAQAGSGLIGTAGWAFGPLAGSRAFTGETVTFGRIATDETGSAFGRSTPLTASQATDLAKRLGYRPTNYLSDGQRVFTNGKDFITPDVTGHAGGVWKGSSVVDDFSRGTRSGTYDYNMNWIGR